MAACSRTFIWVSSIRRKILNDKLSSNLYPSWNFGPYYKNCRRVVEVIDEFYKELRLKKTI